MAVFNFDQVDQYVQNDMNKINFLKLQDDGWYAQVRFMYGAGETFQGFSVHNVGTDPKRPKYVPCLREPGQPLDVCPLCNNGNPTVAQYYIPVYVISITKVINGIPQTPEVVNQVMLFQRGKQFQGSMASVVRQSGGTPLVNNIFNIVRNGKVNDPKANYLVEFVGRDNVSLDQLPERPEVYGSYILPASTYEDLLAYCTPQQPQGVVPRTITTQPVQQSAVNFGGQAPTQPLF